MMVAGIGCRTNVTTADVLAAIDMALAAHQRVRAELDALATGERRSNTPAIHAAARHLALPLRIIDDPALAAVESRLLTRSTASLKAAGSPSLSEAAALAAVGISARLLGPRLSTGHVTCALAVQEDGR